MGIDGIMLNEHHNAPFCMQAKCNIFASILAAMTKKAKIVLLGNPLPLGREPGAARRRALDDRHDLARAGWSPDLSAAAARSSSPPVSTRPSTASDFEEAHDLIVKAWTRPGPFRWEGTHYQHRVVNPWAVPLQKPHPRIWIPGVVSKETIVWAAEHRYPYIALNTPVDRTKQIWQIYDDAAAEAGFTPGPEYHGLLKQIHVAETEEKAIETRASSCGCRASSPACAPGLEHARRAIRQPGQPPRLCRIRHRPVEEPALPPGAGKADAKS